MSAEEELNQRIEDVSDEETGGGETPQTQVPTEIANLLDFFAFLETFRTVKRHLTAMPTFTPRTFWEQIQFVDDGVNRKIAVWMNGSWRSVAVT